MSELLCNHTMFGRPSSDDRYLQWFPDVSGMYALFRISATRLPSFLEGKEVAVDKGSTCQCLVFMFTIRCRVGIEYGLYWAFNRG